MKIAVVGTGYVGLVTGTCLAEMGNEVICIDVDEDKIARLQAGEVPIYEPELETYVQRNVSENRLSFTTDLRVGIQGATTIFLALPTPPEEDGSADLSYILGAADELGTMLTDYTVVVDKSTVPVGTTEKVRAKIAEHASSDFDVVSNPEFLREGFAVADFMKPDRVVIGTSSSRAMEVMRVLYKPFLRQGNPLLFMDEASAEMTKYAANAFLATKISFMNQIANLCEAVGADVDAVRLGIGSDDRIGKRFLFPGIGFGGSCFPKDVLALRYTAGQVGSDLSILDAVTTANESQKHVLVGKIKQHYGDSLSGKTFALWGLAFKPDTDDIREAPALEVIDTLIAAGAHVVAFDPEAIANVKKKYSSKSGLSFAKGRYEALKNADALVIATEWSAFRSADFQKIKSLLKEPIIFDGRNLYELAIMREQGFHYESIGRAVIEGGLPSHE